MAGASTFGAGPGYEGGEPRATSCWQETYGQGNRMGRYSIHLCRNFDVVFDCCGAILADRGHAATSSTFWII